MRLVDGVVRQFCKLPCCRRDAGGVEKPPHSGAVPKCLAVLQGHICPLRTLVLAVQSPAFRPVLAHLRALMAVVIAGFSSGLEPGTFLLLLPASKLHTAGEEVSQSVRNYRARAHVNIKPLV